MLKISITNTKLLNILVSKLECLIIFYDAHKYLVDLYNASLSVFMYGSFHIRFTTEILISTKFFSSILWSKIIDTHFFISKKNLFKRYDFLKFGIWTNEKFLVTDY